MYNNPCGCRSKGRLFVCVESAFAKEVKLTLIEANQYRDIYVIPIKDKIGKIMIDSISMGELSIYSDIDAKNVVYYPNHKIMFEENNYVHKVTIIDRRK